MNIAIVVASTNRPEEIGQLLCSLAAQTQSASAIVLSVVSTTDLPSPLPAHVEVVTGAAGLTAQRNRGLDLVLNRCGVVVFFDDDFLPAANTLQRISQLFETHPDVVSATGEVLLDGVKSGGISYEAALRAVAIFESVPDRPVKNQDILWAYGCNMAFRSAVVGNLRFDENLPLHGWQEDMDFAARLSNRGRVIKTTAFAGVHRGVNKGRSPGLALGFSQMVNPAYLVQKGAMQPKKAATLMVKNFLANHVKSIRPESFVDRRGRARGNWLGLFHLLRGRADPRVILKLK